MSSNSELPGGSAPAHPEVPPPPRTLVRSAGIVGIATLTSRILGLVRDQVLAFFFGAGNAMDAFNVAFRIPNLVRDLFAEGAMTSAFVPTFTKHLTLRGKEDAWRLGNLVLNGLVIVTGLIAAVGILFAEPIVRLLASDYAQVEGKIALTVQLTRILFPFLTLVAVAVAFMGMLNSLGRFFVPALSPAMFNVGTIFAALLLMPIMPGLGLDGIVAIALGALLGGLGQALIQWPLLRREGFRYRPILDPRDEGFRQVLALMVPGTIGLAGVQVNLLVNTILATGEGTGAVSWLNYAFRIMYLPIGLLGVSVATAALPGISRAAAIGDPAELRRSVGHALRLTFVLNIPAMAGLMVLARPVVRLIFERGRFAPEDTEATASALLFYAPGLLGYSAVKIAAPSYYALGESRTPVTVSLVTVVVNVAINVLLVGWIGFRGLALGTGIAALLNAGLLLTLLRRRLGGLDDRDLAALLAKVVVASVVMALVTWGVHAGLEILLPGASVTRQILRVTASICVGAGVFTTAARLLRIEEWNEATGLILRRFARLFPRKGGGDVAP